MSIRYVCYDCRKKLRLSGFSAVNEIRRKFCDRCGTNEDSLEVVGMDEFENATQKYDSRSLKKKRKI